MQIGANTTGMPAELTVATDKSGREHCVVVVKGTFTVGEEGEATLAEEQEPFVFADVHHGDPGETGIEYECDFAPFKPRCDVLVNGSAYAPGGKPTTAVMVGLNVGSMTKTFKVVGDRTWKVFGPTISASQAQPFTTMPVTYDRAFGGADNFHPDQSKHSAFMANPVGRGYHQQLAAKFVDGKPLPNMEEPKRPVTAPHKAYNPMSFGPLGRGWAPRIKYAGTYDQKWLDDVFPFLPADFDERHFQSAPTDQQVEYLKGGEVVRCANLSPAGRFGFTVPKVRCPILYRFRDRDEQPEPCLDTLIIEPDKMRILLVWRAKMALGRKLNALREVVIGTPPAVPRRRATGKPRFRSIPEFIAWKKRRVADRSPAGEG